jgi:hypothetical protein
MSLPTFISRLLAEGRAPVPEPGLVEHAERSATAELLAEFDASWRLDLPGEPPPLNRDVAVWAAAQFFRACQYAVFRDAGPEFDFEPLPREAELRPLPATHYSVDLTYRFLPDLIRQTRAVAEADPLVTELLAWSCRWPLSSAGVSGAVAPDAPVDVAAIVASPSLLRFYVDRIIDRRDIARLDHPAVRQAVAAALGLHHDLAPQLAKALQSQEEVTK